MSSAVAFDTLKFVERLEAGGFSHAQAKAAAEAFADATSQELATKADIAGMGAEMKSEAASVRADLKSEIASVKNELKSEVAAVRADLKTEIASVKAELREVELRMTIKLGGLIMAATGVLLAAIKFVK